MESKWISIIINIIFLLSIVFIGINLLLNVELTKSINLKGETNDFCQTRNKSLNNLDYLACNNKFKKNKIILLLIDSLPFDTLHEIIDFNKTRIPNFFKGEGLDYKQSGALFETIFTGKFSRNYLANSKTEFDTLAQQFKNAGMDIFYKIRKFPIGQLIDNNLFTKVEMHDGEYIPLSRFCESEREFYEKYRWEISNDFIEPSNSNFKEGLNEKLLYQRAHKDLDDKIIQIYFNYTQCFSKNDFNSIVFYTECLDNNIHISYKKYPTVVFEIFYAEQIIKNVIKYINEENDEFALGVLSDHGGQYYYGEDALCNHGCNNPGNEAILFTYTKELANNYEKYNMNEKEIPLISINDYPCVIAQTLNNINLPLESTCTPRIIGNDPIIKFSSIKSKEVQLKTYLEKLCKKYPALHKEYYEKYYEKLYKHKFIDYFKDINTIYQTDDQIFADYIKYIMNIQNDLFNDVIISSHNRIYYIIFYSSFIFFIVALLYHFTSAILLIRNKIYSKLNNTKKNEMIVDLNQSEFKSEEENTFLKKLVKYFIIIFIILISESIACLIFNDVENISGYINYSIFIKFFGLLFITIIITFSNNLQHNQNYKKIIYIMIFIIILNLSMHFIRLYSLVDKSVNTQAKSDFVKIYISYPLLFIYAIIEFYNSRNYFVSKKYNIKYNYIILPYLTIASYYYLKFDISVKQHMPGHDPSTINFMLKIYFSIFLLLIFIKPFYKKEKEDKTISNEIFNTKLFFIVVIDFICIETERVLLISLFFYVLFYLCECYKKEKDIFLKLIYIILISSYPQIFFIGNQGTYSLDASIKITVKCPSKWADDLPIVMGIIFTVHKFKYYIFSSSYLFSIFKRNKNKYMSFYTKFIIEIFLIQLYALIVCYLYFLKKEREQSYIQLLFLIATKAIPLILYELNYLINFALYKFFNTSQKTSEEYEYKALSESEENIRKLIIK